MGPLCQTPEPTTTQTICPPGNWVTCAGGSDGNTWVCCPDAANCSNAFATPATKGACCPAGSFEDQSGGQCNMGVMIVPAFDGILAQTAGCTLAFNGAGSFPECGGGTCCVVEGAPAPDLTVECTSEGSCVANRNAVATVLETGECPPEAPTDCGGTTAATTALGMSCELPGKGCCGADAQCCDAGQCCPTESTCCGDGPSCCPSGSTCSATGECAATAPG